MTTDLMGAAVRLATSLDSLAALAAHLRVETEGLDVDPEVRELLGRVATALVGDSVDFSDPATAQAVIGMTRAFLRQAVDLVEHPGRRGDWAEVDPALLQGLGRLSGAIAGAFVAAEADLDGLGDALRAPGAAFLDVGTGTGWLAVAIARAYPSVRVVGLDVYDVALRMAADNVSSAGLDDRIELRHGDVAALDEADTYAAIWLPLPFLPRRIVPDAIRAAARALQPGGWLLPGTFTGAGDWMSDTLSDLRSLRSGGEAWSPDDVAAMLSDAGLDDAHEVPRTWAAPARLHAARRPVSP